MTTLLSVCSLNIRGFNDNHKIDCILSDLRALPQEIFLVQETHVNNQYTSSKIDRKWDGRIIWSYGLGKSAGCAILIKNSFQGKIKDYEIDTEGRVVSLRLELPDRKSNICLVNVYAPVEITARKNFLASLPQYFKPGFPLLLGGDFNCVESRQDQV